MRFIDCKKDLQVFNTINSEPKDTLHIKKHKLLGEGGQGFVYLVQMLDNDDAFFADKAFTITRNSEEAARCLRAQLHEFVIGRNLKHPNIVEYLYFMRKVNT